MTVCMTRECGRSLFVEQGETVTEQYDVEVDDVESAEGGLLSNQRDFLDQEPPQEGWPDDKGDIRRFGMWLDEGDTYKVGGQELRFFCGIAQPVKMKPNTESEKSYRKAELAAKWGLADIKRTKQTLFLDRYNYRAVQNVHLVVTGWYNLTAKWWGWAALFTRRGGLRSGAYFNFDKKWYYDNSWVTVRWNIDPSRQHKILLQHCGRDAEALVWEWLIPKPILHPNHT